MTDKELEQKIKEMDDELENRQSDDVRGQSLFTKIKQLLSKFNQRILDSNGFLTKEGGYLCKAEWHAVAIPAGMVSASFMLPEPLGLLTFLSYLFMNKKGFDLLESDYEGHWNDVMEEYAYAASSFAVTIAYWMYWTEETVNGAGEISRGIITLFLGA